MDLYTPPRPTKVKSIISTIHTEKTSPLQTPKGLKQVSRALSLIDNKRPQKSPVTTIQHLSRVFKRVPDSDSSQFLQKRSHSPNNMIINFVSESQAQEIRVLKAEIFSLQSTIHSLKNKINKLTEDASFTTSQLSIYKKGYLSLIEFSLEATEISLKIKQDLAEVVKSSLIDDEDIYKALQKFYCRFLENPFDVRVEGEGCVDTARFPSIGEREYKELMTPIGEVIVIEDFSEEDGEYLKLKAGERIKVLKKINEFWSFGASGLRIGKFPIKCVLND